MKNLLGDHSGFFIVAGTRMVKVVPTPSVLATDTVPPCASTS
jgi:hypothetical protein